MRRLLPLLFVIGCHSSGQENLGLSGQTTTIDVSKLAQPEELVRALSLSGNDLDARLGAHKMDAASTLKLESPAREPTTPGHEPTTGREPTTLDETFAVEADGAGGVHLVHDNSRGNGFEAVATGGQLYTKPRYGRFVRRRVEGDNLARLRVAAETPAAAYVRLLAPWLQIHEAGAVVVAGHAGVKLTLSARTSPSSVPNETEPGKQWRRTLQVRYIDGDIVLDAKTGAPLQVRLEAAYGFTRDGKPVQAALSFKQSTTSATSAIAPPADFAELGRARPIVDKQQLLEGLK
ncbi:MAG TPA: hypothetical protein VIA18_14060 [Polyangia bacterium]|jgi:hypothetical protein|nr:hypothetical protein [Polyangia bacterium]